MESVNSEADRDFDDLLTTLRVRFEQHPERHLDASWDDVRLRLAAAPGKLAVLQVMEASGGQPDVVRDRAAGDALAFFDCSSESPAGRRGLCYDDAALQIRKRNKPKGSALGMADAMGARILTEAQYRGLQEVGAFDLKTSSWIDTPDDVRALGGALFCDRRYNRVFTFHNGADSYYAARGFRAMLEL